MWVDAKATPPAPAEDCLSFNPNNLTIHHSGNNYVVRDGNHAMVAFNSQAHAQNAINRIRQHGFKRICFVGRPFTPGHGMTYFLPSPGPSSPVAPVPPMAAPGSRGRPSVVSRPGYAADTLDWTATQRKGRRLLDTAKKRRIMMS